MSQVLGQFSIDPLAALLATATLAVTFILWRKGKSNARLTYEIRSTPLVNVHSAAQGRIALTLDGNPVQAAHLLQMRFANSGSAPIRTADFERPLRVELGDRAAVLSVEVADETPHGLSPPVSAANGAVEVDPLLLNPGDSFTLHTLVQDYEGPAELEAPRVAGLTRVVDSRAPLSGWRRLLQRFATSAAFPILIVIVLAFFTSRQVQDISRGETSVVLRSGERLCGEFIGATENTIVLKIDGKPQTIQSSQLVAATAERC